MQSITAATLEALLDAGAVRALRAVPQPDGWTLVIVTGLAERVLRSDRRPVRHWHRLDTLAAYCRALGARQLDVHLT